MEGRTIGTTARHGIPWPAGTDVPAGHTQIKAAADEIDVLLPYRSTSTPAHKDGLIWFDPTTRLTQMSDGTRWYALGTPPGVVQDYAGATAPTGWLMCDGQAVSRTTYADLFAVVGTTHGAGDGSTTFNVPNAKGRATVHRDTAQPEFDTLGEVGGAKTHQLTVAEMPSHTHTQNAHNHTQNAHNHTQNPHTHSFDGDTDTYSAGAADSVAFGQTPPSHTSYSGGVIASTTATNDPATATNLAATATNQNTGSNGSHNNLQPYLVLNKIIKV